MRSTARRSDPRRSALIYALGTGVGWLAVFGAVSFVHAHITPGLPALDSYAGALPWSVRVLILPSAAVIASTPVAVLGSVAVVLAALGRRGVAQGVIALALMSVLAGMALAAAGFASIPNVPNSVLEAPRAAPDAAGGCPCEGPFKCLGAFVCRCQCDAQGRVIQTETDADGDAVFETATRMRYDAEGRLIRLSVDRDGDRIFEQVCRVDPPCADLMHPCEMTCDPPA